MTFPSAPKLKLNNGVEIPMIGSGAYAPPDPEEQSRVKDWIGAALKNGYRHIDTAQIYGTEASVGEAIGDSGIPRDEIFLTTKLPWNHQGRVRESFEESVKTLGTYIDLYLLHWPQAIVYEEGNFYPKNSDGTFKTTDEFNFHQAWAEMEKLLDTGKVRAIGVSNFSIKHLEKLLETAKVVPAVNQVELHPYLSQNALRDYCIKKGIALTAYAPSGYSPVRSDPLMVNLAKKYNVTPNQVTLAWHLSRNTIIVPKSENTERQKENLTVPKIAEEDLEKVWTLDRGERMCNKADPNTGQVFGWTYEQLGWIEYPLQVAT